MALSTGALAEKSEPFCNSVCCEAPKNGGSEGGAHIDGAAAHAKLPIRDPKGEASTALHALLAGLAALGALVPSVALAPAKPTRSPLCVAAR